MSCKKDLTLKIPVQLKITGIIFPQCFFTESKVEETLHKGFSVRSPPVHEKGLTRGH